MMEVVVLSHASGGRGGGVPGCGAKCYAILKMMVIVEVFEDHGTWAMSCRWAATRIHLLSLKLTPGHLTATRD